MKKQLLKIKYGECLCAVDVGNSRISFCVFKSKRILHMACVDTPKGLTPEVFARRNQKVFRGFRKYPIGLFLIASVVPGVNGKLKKFLSKTFRAKVAVLKEEYPIPIRNCYRKEKEVGADRLVNALAAHRRFKRKTLVIDFGTAVTFDLVTSRGAYAGGMIFPGINVSIKALVYFAEMIPDISLRKPRELIGRDTATSMQSGICYGYGILCDGIIDLFRKRYGPGISVIATGGQADLIAAYSKKLKIIDKYLTVKGIQEAYLVLAGEA